MKKIVVFMAIISSLMSFTTTVFCSSEDWVGDAMSAASDFLDEPVQDDYGFVSPIFETFKNIVKAVNRVLLIILAGLSVISLAIIGIRYILGGSSPQQQVIAKKNLKKAFIGMAYGFGAYIIWTISMGIVTFILGSFAN